MSITTLDYLNQLKEDKKQLVNKLIEKEIDASYDETFTELVPKVAQGLDGGLNVYAQAEEPNKKEGIWINTSEIGHNDYIRLKDIPYSFYKGSAVAIGTDVYLFGSQYSSASQRYAYKYDTLTNTYTQLADIPYTLAGSVIAVGTDIYLFGCGSSYNYTYKYNILTNEYTKLENTPDSFVEGGLATFEDDIYLFLNNNSVMLYCTYKYNIISNLYTSIKQVPYGFARGSVVYINSDVYLFGSSISNQHTQAYKYDILTNDYTQLTNIPYEFYGGCACVIDNDIYLFGSESHTSYAYIYNILTNSYTKFQDIPYSLRYSCAVSINKHFYLFGSYISQYTRYAYTYNYIQDMPQINIYDYNEIKLIQKPRYIQYTNMAYSSYFGASIINKENVYIFSGMLSSTGFYKYNLINEKTTALASLPQTFTSTASAVLVDDNIYIWTQKNGYGMYYSYKYNISSNTFTSINNYGGAGRSVVYDDNTIFICSGSSLYKYDITTNTYTKLETRPYSFDGCGICIFNNKVYTFGSNHNSESYAKFSYSYDIATNTYTAIKNTPIIFQETSYTFNNNNSHMYFFGSLNNSSYYNIAYKYNFLTNEYIIIDKPPYLCLRCSASSINDCIYLFGGYTSTNESSLEANPAAVYKYCDDINKKNKNIYVLQDSIFKYKDIDWCFAYIYDDNEIKKYPCYYGDGEKWNLIENE